MSAPNLFPNGYGGSSGAALASRAPIYTPGNVWYVSNSVGSDSASPRGKDRARPLATLAQAYTNAAAGDTIVLLASHTETLTSTQTFAKAGLVVIGEGAGSSRPKFTRAADLVMFDFTAAGNVLWNIYFVASSVASASSARARAGAVAFIMRDCYFECGANDQWAACELVTGAGQVVVRDTSFVSTATLTSAQPESGLRITNAVTDLDLDTVTFDGGATGWSNQYALQGTAAVTRLRGIDVSLLNDSDAILATGTSGYLALLNKSGSARLVWTP